MTDLSWMLDVLPGTSIADNIRKLLEVYRSLDEEIDRFAHAATIGCPDGCGRCCEETDPEVTQIEADFIAVYLSYSAVNVIGALNTRHSGCVFYDPSSPLHCTIYGARPLVCRAFAFTTIRDKNGAPLFRYCRHMPAAGSRTLVGAEIERGLHAQPPEVTLYGVRVAGLSGHGEPERRPLSEAVAKSLGRVMLLRRLSANNDAPDSGGRAA